MPAPTYVGAGAGATALDTSSGTVSKAGCTAGNLIVVHIVLVGTGGFATYAFPVSNVENLAGSDNDMTTAASANMGSPTSANHTVMVGRAIANGSCSTDFSRTGGSDDVYARMYEFANVAAGTTWGAVAEDGGGTHDAGLGQGSTISDLSIQSNGANRLGVHLVAADNAVSMASFTGESNGDWTEAEEFQAGSGSLATLQLQTAAMPSATTIDGGTFAAGASVGWGTIGFALIGTASPIPVPRLHANPLRW